MKAQFVKENLEFERGMDPKSAMGIGQDKVIFNQWEKLMTQKGIGSLNIEKSLNDKLHFVVYVSQFPDAAKSGYKKVMEYLGDYLYGFYNNKGGEIKIRIKPEYNQNFINAYNMRYPDWPIEIHESLDFERSKDSKRALRVGQRETYPDIELYEEIHEFWTSMDPEKGWPREFEGASDIDWSKNPVNFKVFFKTLAEEVNQYSFYLTKNGIESFYQRYTDAGGGQRAYKMDDYVIRDFDYFIRILQTNHVQYIPK